MPVAARILVSICTEYSNARWLGIAVGDCNLFHVSASGDLLHSAPLAASADFGNAPVALSSINRNAALFQEHLTWLEGSLRTDEHLLLATDALAAWLLAAVEAGEQPVQRLLALDSDAEFRALVDELRAGKRLRNDDTTLLVINYAPATMVSLEPDAPSVDASSATDAPPNGAPARKRARRRSSRPRRRKSN
jgi:hypothetical protein